MIELFLIELEIKQKYRVALEKAGVAQARCSLLGIYVRNIWERL